MDALSTWLAGFTNSDWLNLALLIATIVGLTVGLRQFVQSVKAERARLLRDLVRDIQNDEKVYGIFYEIEYGSFGYDDEFHGSDKEKGPR